jgi:hypothetical protein
MLMLQGIAVRQDSNLGKESIDNLSIDIYIDEPTKSE